MTEAHSQTEDRTGRDKSRHRKNSTDRGPLTCWRPHMDGQVRTQKESDRPRPTHKLETPQGGTSQDTERILPTKTHSHTGDRMGRDTSRHGKNPTDRGPLTYWRPHGEGQVRTCKESDRPRPTHFLRQHREGQVMTQKESDRPRPLTGWRPPHREGHARKMKKRVRTHKSR